jgi:hypothetical protein
VVDWCREAGLEEVRTRHDLSQRPRVVSARKPVATAEQQGG